MNQQSSVAIRKISLSLSVVLITTNRSAYRNNLVFLWGKHHVDFFLLVSIYVLN